LVVWHAADHADATLFQRRVAANAPARIREGRVTALDGAALARAEPALGGRFQQGWLLDGEGQLDNRQLLAALDLALAGLGVPIHAGVAIDADNWPRAGLTIDCRGLGARRALPGLRGIRGEVVRVVAPGIGLRRPVRLLHPRYPIYIAPKEQDRYVIGATEIESEDDSPVSVRSALELLSAAFSVHPGFGEARILELNAQCRPTLADQRPAIAFDARADAPGRGGAGRHGAPRIAVNGLYRHGFMIAPEVVHEAVALVHAVLDEPRDARAGFAAWRAATSWPALASGASPTLSRLSD
ncbi:MAG: FAD-dependent oxidoreductase, partial [Janthinobacterium lividum]